MRSAIIFLICLLFGVAVCDRNLIYTRDAAPNGWVVKGSPADTDLVRFHLALYQQNLDQLEEIALAVSDPKDERYGSYLTINEVLDIVATPVEDVAAVLKWINKAKHSKDAKKIENRRDAIVVITTVRHAKAIFETDYKLFINEESGKAIIRQWGDYSIPEAVSSVVEMITGVADFPVGRKMGHTKTHTNPDPDATNSCNVPYSILNLYNQTQNLTISNSAVAQAPYSQIEAPKEGFGYQDYIKFDKLNGLVNYPISCIIGDAANDYYNRSDDGEATLDIQMETSIGLGAKTCFWVMTEWMYNFANEIFSSADSPLVNSISYGWPEFKQCENSVLESNCSGLGIPTSEAYVVRAEMEFAKIASRGLTVIASSGDTGSPGDSNVDCTNKVHPLGPAYPATSKWITTVGATTLTNTAGRRSALGGEPPVCSNPQCTCSTSTDEVACVLANAEFTTGGGFSVYNAQPAWQAKAVAAYLASNAKYPNASLFNSSNRAFPDISALGNCILNIVSGSIEFVGGTSASCPLIGGMVSQLNNWRLNNNLPAMGFMNPLIYQIYEAEPTAFQDITVGGTACTESECCPGLGFSCHTGWDPATGVGTPNFGKIMDYVQNMPMPKKFRN